MRPEVVGLIVLGVSALTGWYSVLAFCAGVKPYGLSKLGLQPWGALAYLGISCAVGAYAIKKSGLLALASQARSAALPAPAGPWSCWFAHFKLSFVAFLAALLAGWFARRALVLWLSASLPEGSFGYFSSPFEGWKGMLLAVLGVSWVPVVPFIASDVWRLLMPLTNARAARLRLPFALASGLAALVPLLVIHHYAWAWVVYAFVGPQPGPL